MTYVVVGFKVSSSKSVYYGQANSAYVMSEQVVHAFVIKKADFVSVRKVGEKNEVSSIVRPSGKSSKGV